MEKIEQLVRKALADQEEERIMRIVDAPFYRESLKDLLVGVYEEVCAPFGNAVSQELESDAEDCGHAINERESIRKWEEIRPHLVNDVAGLFDNYSANLRKLVSWEAQGYTCSAEQVEQTRQSNKIFNEFHPEAHEPILERLRIQDRFVRKLVEVANANGIDKATQISTQDAAYRELYHDQELYRQANRRRLCNFLESLEEAFTTAYIGSFLDRDANLLFGIISAVHQSYDKFKNQIGTLRERFLNDFIEEDVRRIYNTSR